MKHEVFEKNSLILLIGILVVVSIGGIVQIAPLFWVESTIEKVKGMRPYTPLEQAGRDIYVREGCYGCHSQMIRTAARRGRALRPLQPRRREHVRPPLPVGLQAHRADLARVGGKYSDQWQAEHLINPRAVVPESIMPGYPWLAERKLDTRRHRRAAEDAASCVGVPYTRRDDRQGASRIWSPGHARQPAGARAAAPLSQGQGRASSTASPAEPTELDALVAYLQMLGTLVDFATFDASGPNLR